MIQIHEKTTDLTAQTKNLTNTAKQEECAGNCHFRLLLALKRMFLFVSQHQFAV